jgi:hypothetical protein
MIPVGHLLGTRIFGLWEPGAQSPGDLTWLIGRTRAELLIALDNPTSTTGLPAPHRRSHPMVRRGMAGLVRP